MQGSRLTGEQKAFIVRRLAAFSPPQDIVASFVAHFRTRCETYDVLACDPAVVLLPPDLHQIFTTERARVLSDPAAAPLAERQARIVVLNNMAFRAIANNQPGLARECLAQIKGETESAGATGGGSEPVGAIELLVTDPKPLPPEQMPPNAKA